VPADSLARIDGVLVRFFVLPVPLYQPTCSGDTVLLDEVRTVLSVMGLPVASTKALSQLDLKSLREYAKGIGVPQAAQVTCFSPDWIVSSTQAPGELELVSLSVGAPPPPLGEPVLVGHATLESLKLQGNTGSATLDGALNVEGATQFAETELIVSGAPSGVGLAQLNDPVALATLAPRFDPKAESTTMAVKVVLTETQYVVPATAVVDALGARACVEESKDHSTIPVRVVNSSISGLIVDFGASTSVRSIAVSPEHSSCE
jgi:hypothetical protein